MTESKAIAQVTQARQLLVEARDLADIKAVRDMAEAARLYARAAGLGQDAMNEAAEVKLRAERKAGEALADMEKNKGGRPPETCSSEEQVSEQAPTLPELGITRKQAMNWQAEASVPEPIFEEHIAEAKAEGKPLTTAGVVRLVREEPTLPPTQDDIIEAAGGDDGGQIRIARLRSAYSSGAKATLELIALRPESVAEVLRDHQVSFARSFIRDVRDWCGRLESALDQGIRLVDREEAVDG